MNYQPTANECVDQLMTIIDFCNEVACAKGGLAIQDAHDVANVLLGGERTRSWEWVNDWLTLIAPRDVTPAWPDVRERMKIIVERLERE